MENSMLNWLKSYLKETPRDVVQRELDEIMAMDLPGPSAIEYLEAVQEYHYCASRHEISQTEKIEIMTPDFSGSNFFINLDVWKQSNQLLLS